MAAGEKSSEPKRSRIPELGRPDVTEFEIGRTTHRVAEVQPMDLDGVRTMTIGTIAWGVVTVALLPFWGTLQEDGRTWWVWTAIAGLGLGLIGIEYCKRRREALRAAAPAAASAGSVATTTPVESEAPAAEETAPPRPAPGGRRRKN